MDILFFLIVWGVVGASVAAFGVLVVRGLLFLAFRHSSDDVQKPARDRVIRKATLFPVVCLVWAVFILIFQGLTNATCLHRDIRIGNSHYCPFPNGFSLIIFNLGDEGTVYRTNHNVLEDADGIWRVKELQVSGTHLLGGSHRHDDEHLGQDNPPLDRYFLIDTQTGNHIEFASEDALRDAASKLGVTLKLEPIFEVYRRYRFTWFDTLAAALLILPPLVLAGFLIASVMRVRRVCDNSSHDPSLLR